MPFSKAKSLTDSIIDIKTFVGELVIKQLVGGLYDGEFVEVGKNTVEHKEMCESIMKIYNDGKCEFDVVNDMCNESARKYIKVNGLEYDADTDSIVVCMTVNEVAELETRYGLNADFNAMFNCTNYVNDVESLPDNFFTVAFYNKTPDKDGNVITMPNE